MKDKYPRIECSSDFKKSNILVGTELDEIENGFVDILTDNATFTIKKNTEGYIIDVYDIDGECVQTMTVWNDDLEVEKE